MRLAVAVGISVIDGWRAPLRREDFRRDSSHPGLELDDLRSDFVRVTAQKRGDVFDRVAASQRIL
jgi:hypothetical protein